MPLNAATEVAWVSTAPIMDGGDLITESIGCVSRAQQLLTSRSCDFVLQRVPAQSSTAFAFQQLEEPLWV